MCYAQHHLKRLLAYSTVTHAGLMLIAVALLRGKAIAGFTLYVIGHGMVKGSLFLGAGIVLHRLRAISARRLHGKGRGMIATPALFIIGALALAALPSTLLFSGEGAIQSAARELHLEWTEWVFLFAGLITAAAVLRFSFRTFFGWGEPAPEDQASKVGELPETESGERNVPAVLFVPALVLLVLAFALPYSYRLKSVAVSGGEVFTDVNSYRSVVLENASVAQPQPEPERATAAEHAKSLIICLVAVFAALLTARRLPGFAALEEGFGPLRKLHSGHPGDYVAWLTAGTAALGAAVFFLFR